MSTLPIPVRSRRNDLPVPFPSALATLAKRARRLPGSTRLAAAFMLALIVVVVIGPYLYPVDPFALSPRNRMQEPFTPGYPLGSDHLGRDVLARIIHGGRLSLTVGGGVLLLTICAGVIIGLTAGAFPRWDALVMRFMDGFQSLPSLVLAIALMVTLGGSVFNVIIALSIVYTPRMARVVRSGVLTLWNMDYVVAARSIGASPVRILLKHVLPNCFALVVVQASFILAQAMITEASLSFLGVGMDPGQPSWGNMMNQARLYMRDAPWLVLLPGSFLMLTVLSLNVLGDYLRDSLDPVLKRAR